MTLHLLPGRALLLARALALAAAVATAGITGPALAGEAQPLARDPAVEQRMIAITQDLRCLVCQNESLAGSRAELAEDLRREVRELIGQGKSDAEIVEHLVARYGNFVRYRPPFEPSTWLLWIGPFALLLLGAAGLIRHLRRRASAVEPPLAEDERARAEAQLKAVSQESTR